MELTPARAAAGPSPPSRGDSDSEEAADGGALSPWPLTVAVVSLGIFIAYADRSNISTAVLSMAAEFGWSKTFEGCAFKAARAVSSSSYRRVASNCRAC